ncbi:putative metal-binding motif-containing protein [Flagellimonas eckloniae]|uniref:Uncharacterized protein n=1 Tax=Flagellimonas eckloniae TaxID=346185 RepID=A0A0Q1CEV9_9FLAO|nr:putative metal-binding motif-containing protein [Allomuricauda eckloniae]KQC29286.1 hypothetical protein AAY42_04720 [Allomuricauda eckloniae]
MKTSYSSIFRASFVGIALFVMISCSNDDNCTTQTFYLDKDLDGFGGIESTSACKAPTTAVGQYVTKDGDTNDNDPNINPGCDLVFYLDEDNDGFGVGDPLSFCKNPDEDLYTDNDTTFDCDDTNPNINPDTTEIANDGIDNNCDGIELVKAVIWTGPDMQFSKPGGLTNWVDGSQFHDQLTENVSLTRSNNGYITNISWWVNEITQVPTENEDLEWEYKGRDSEPVANIGTAEPAGGPQGVRWAILEQGGETKAWDNFNLYGTLGDPTHFYSLNNIASICDILDGNFDLIRIIDDFGVEGNEEEYLDFDTLRFQFLEGKSLGVWLVEEDIYLTLTFDSISNSFGDMSYTRSSPVNN